MSDEGRFSRRRALKTLGGTLGGSALLVSTSGSAAAYDPVTEIDQDPVSDDSGEWYYSPSLATQWFRGKHTIAARKDRYIAEDGEDYVTYHIDLVGHHEEEGTVYGDNSGYDNDQDKNIMDFGFEVDSRTNINAINWVSNPSSSGRVKMGRTSGDLDTDYETDGEREELWNSLAGAALSGGSLLLGSSAISAAGLVYALVNLGQEAADDGPKERVSFGTNGPWRAAAYGYNGLEIEVPKIKSGEITLRSHTNGGAEQVEGEGRKEAAVTLDLNNHRWWN